ncbi:ATP-binding protein [Argonema antarcticum]|uniref:ATP-binding protein n=1 Tax=Argonema antarcticum TaxID=2942763 RepID=UPI002013739F|nr:ATP-binding protein [Argonema antarcticum]MCL1470583.1 ATP-binding protein [Argonema antarcticum A004/B2]
MEPLTVPGTLDSLKPIAEYVMAAAAAAGLDKKASYNLRLAVDEIATNVIIHGYEEAGRDGNLVLQAEIDDRVLKFTVEDTATFFDATQKADPDDLDLPLEKRQIGGLGVYLAIKGVDKFLYERSGDRNRTIFIVNRFTS